MLIFGVYILFLSMRSVRRHIYLKVSLLYLNKHLAVYSSFEKRTLSSFSWTLLHFAASSSSSSFFSPQVNPAGLHVQKEKKKKKHFFFCNIFFSPPGKVRLGNLRCFCTEEIKQKTEGDVPTTHGEHLRLLMCN